MYIWELTGTPSFFQPNAEAARAKIWPSQPPSTSLKLTQGSGAKSGVNPGLAAGAPCSTSLYSTQETLLPPHHIYFQEWFRVIPETIIRTISNTVSLICPRAVLSEVFLPFFFFLAVPHSMWDLSSLTRNPCPLHYEHEVLATGPPGKSKWEFFFNCHYFIR